MIAAYFSFTLRSVINGGFSSTTIIPCILQGNEIEVDMASSAQALTAVILKTAPVPMLNVLLSNPKNKTLICSGRTWSPTSESVTLVFREAGTNLDLKFTVRANNEIEIDCTQNGVAANANQIFL